MCTTLFLFTFHFEYLPLLTSRSCRGQRIDLKLGVQTRLDLLFRSTPHLTYFAMSPFIDLWWPPGVTLVGGSSWPPFKHCSGGQGLPLCKISARADKVWHAQHVVSPQGLGPTLKGAWRQGFGLFAIWPKNTIPKCAVECV